jgi:prevent-host-death family protein
MLDITQDIHSLTEFKRDTSRLVRQMKRARRPVVLTVNGRAALVVQDAAAYQRMLDRLERMEAIAGIRRGLEQVQRGESRPAEEFFAQMRRKYDMPR